MLMKSDYRDRALGLVGAFAVLIIGIIATGALASPPVTVSPDDASHAVNLSGQTESDESIAERLSERIPVC